MFILPICAAIIRQTSYTHTHHNTHTWYICHNYTTYCLRKLTWKLIKFLQCINIHNLFQTHKTRYSLNHTWNMNVRINSWGWYWKGMFNLCVTTVCCQYLCCNRKEYSVKSSRHFLDGTVKTGFLTTLSMANTQRYLHWVYYWFLHSKLVLWKCRISHSSL
jgi:hypothetical protein